MNWKWTIPWTKWLQKWRRCIHSFSTIFFSDCKPGEKSVFRQRTTLLNCCELPITQKKSVAIFLRNPRSYKSVLQLVRFPQRAWSMCFVHTVFIKLSKFRVRVFINCWNNWCLLYEDGEKFWIQPSTIFRHVVNSLLLFVHSYVKHEFGWERWRFRFSIENTTIGFGTTRVIFKCYPGYDDIHGSIAKIGELIFDLIVYASTFLAARTKNLFSSYRLMFFQLHSFTDHRRDVGVQLNNVTEVSLEISDSQMRIRVPREIPKFSPRVTRFHCLDNEIST